jgi:hypothetical protein
MHVRWASGAVMACSTPLSFCTVPATPPAFKARTRLTVESRCSSRCCQDHLPRGRGDAAAAAGARRPTHLGGAAGQPRGGGCRGVCEAARCALARCGAYRGSTPLGWSAVLSPAQAAAPSLISPCCKIPIRPAKVWEAALAATQSACEANLAALDARMAASGEQCTAGRRASAADGSEGGGGSGGVRGRASRRETRATVDSGAADAHPGAGAAAASFALQAARRGEKRRIARGWHTRLCAGGVGMTACARKMLPALPLCKQRAAIEKCTTHPALATRFRAAAGLSGR